MSDGAPDLLESRPADEATADRFMAPPTIPHYEPGPVTTRMIELDGVLWQVTYHAQRDDLGWRVMRAECRPVEGSQKFFRGGDILHIRVKAGEDFGPLVEVLIDSPTGARRQRINRSDIMHVERYVAPAS